jgi:hypothetical protein
MNAKYKNKLIKKFIPLVFAVLPLNFFWLTAQADDSSVVQTNTSDIVQAANVFLAALSDAQRTKVVYDFKDEAQRKRWSNLPVPFVKRGGLRFGDLTDTQRKAALAVVASALSPMGFEKAMAIVEGDEILKATDHGPGGPPGQGGPNFNGPPGGGRQDFHPPDSNGGPMRNGGPPGAATFGRDNYYISFLGQPSSTEPWMIQFGGHHLGLNITLVGNESTMAPSHTGAQPAIYELEGKTVRPFGRESDKAIALLSSMDEAQKKKAILGFEIQDLVLGPGRDGKKSSRRALRPRR